MGKYFKILVIGLTLLSTNSIYCQSDELRARSSFVHAEDSYTIGDYKASIKHLLKARDILGGPNPKIQYLLVQSYAADKDYANAQKELDTYFDVASEEDDHYSDMVRQISKIEAKKEEADEKKLAEERRRKAREKDREMNKLIEPALKWSFKNLKYDSYDNKIVRKSEKYDSSLGNQCTHKETESFKINSNTKVRITSWEKNIGKKRKPIYETNYSLYIDGLSKSDCKKTSKCRTFDWNTGQWSDYSTKRTDCYESTTLFLGSNKSDSYMKTLKVQLEKFFDYKRNN